MTPAGHLLSGYLAGSWAARRLSHGPDRRLVTLAGVAAGIAPDFDVALGLIGGYEGAGLHRGVTHSLLGAAMLGGLAALALRRQAGAVFLAGALGVLTHIFWDSLNFWGCQILWPSMFYWSANLMHEGDWIALGIMALGVLLVWRGHSRPAAVWLAAAIPLFLAMQWWGRTRAGELARVELSGRRTAVYAARQLDCRWMVLSEGDGDMRIHCSGSALARSLRPVFRTTVRDDFFTRASQASPSVREFIEKCPFAFAEERPATGGSTLVVWRDLREVPQQDPRAEPTGLYLEVDAGGRILSERHNWLLKAW